MFLALGVALIQLNQINDKSANVKNAVKLIREAVAKYNPRIVALPETFNTPYAEKNFASYAEYIPGGETTTALSSLAKELKVYIMGGSYPEIDKNDAKRFYNTIVVFSPTGEIIATHRKV